MARGGTLGRVGWVLVPVLALACSAPAGDGLVVGSLDDPEGEIVATLYAELLEGNGIDVERRLGTGSRTEVLDLLEAGEVDLYPDHSGDGLAAVAGASGAGGPVPSVSATASRFRRRLRERGLSVFDPSLASRRPVVVVTFDQAERTRIFEVSGLTQLDEPLVVGVAPGQRAAFDLDDLGADSVVELGSGRAALRALAAGDVDAVVVPETEGALAGSDVVVLVDDGGTTPANNLIPVAHIEDRDLGEAVYRQLDRLAEELTTADVRELHRRVGIEGEPPDRVARDLLADKGLIR